MRSVAVFCGSSSGRHDAYRAAAEATGREIARRGLRLVYGGGKVGLMGALADAVLAEGGEAIGVIPEHLKDEEIAHEALTALEIVPSMHARKARMAELADGFLALPGGYGTLEEFCEVLTWTQLGLQNKPCALLDVDGFYSPLMAFFDRATAEGFVRPEHRSIILMVATPAEALDRLANWQGEVVPKWWKEGK
ncbi:TIGR00730 family Rossman fold protein [soil metagenome]